MKLTSTLYNTILLILVNYYSVFRPNISLERSCEVDRESDGPDQRAELPSRLQQEVRNSRRAGRRLHPHRHPEPIE